VPLKKEPATVIWLGLFKKYPFKRTFLGMIVRPQKQMRFALMFAGGALLSIAALVALTAIVFNHTLKNLADSQKIDLEIGFLLRDTMVWPFFVMITGVFFIGSFVVFLSIRLSNRIYGPLVPLMRHIQNMKQGVYSSRVVLRQNDELTELRDALNELAAILEARNQK
jgi:signal transduction histidine kinase